MPSDSPALRGLQAMRGVMSARTDYDLIDAMASTPREWRFAAMDALNRAIGGESQSMTDWLKGKSRADILALLDRAIAEERAR